jgi:hypothetical protein
VKPATVLYLIQTPPFSLFVAYHYSKWIPPSHRHRNELNKKGRRRYAMKKRKNKLRK